MLHGHVFGPLLLLHVFYPGTHSSFHNGFNNHWATGDYQQLICNFIQSFSCERQNHSILDMFALSSQSQTPYHLKSILFSLLGLKTLFPQLVFRHQHQSQLRLFPLSHLSTSNQSSCPVKSFFTFFFQIQFPFSSVLAASLIKALIILEMVICRCDVEPNNLHLPKFRCVQCCSHQNL